MAVAIHTVTAFVYAGVPARPFWNAAVLAPRFLASAFCSGPAVILVVLGVLRGTLDVSAVVEEVAASGADLAYQGEVEIAAAVLLPAAPDELASYFPPAGASGMAVTLAGAVGAWSLRSSREACAPLALTGAAASAGAFADLVEESRGDAELCVSSEGGVQLLEARLVRSGAARTPALAAVAPPALRYESRFAARLPAEVFDGTTLDLGLLAGHHGPLPLAGALSVEGWYEAELAGVARFDFTPTIE